MAVNDGDRVSTAKLLETLKGLQASRHLGSEPEVVTETVKYPAVVSPAVGTYQTVEELNAAMGQEPDENRFPIKVYTSVAVPADGTFPFTVNEPSGEYVEITKKVTVQGVTMYGQADFPDDGDVSSYTGYAIGQYQGGSGVIWAAIRVVNGSGEFDFYPWEMTAYAETTTTKTKHTIKQDYVPNADWNVNDPDADGYVQGRTHWVERTVGDIPVTTEQGMSTVPEMVKPEGFKAGTTTWKPDYEAIAFEETQDGKTITWYLLAEDENGNQITNASSIFGGETFYTGVAVVDRSAASGQNTFMVIGRLNNAEIKPDYVIAVDEFVHKLDRKFYDYTEPFDPTGYTKDSDISIKTMHGPSTHSYDFVRLPNGLAYGNITLHVDSWDDTTKTGTFSTVGTPLANPGSMVGGTAYVNGGIVFFTVEADGSNPRISNPIPSDLLVVNRASMWIPQMFIRKEDE